MKTGCKSLLVVLLVLTVFVGESQAFWVWTPETNKWVNPKYSVKETPQEQLKYALDFYEAKEYDEALRELKKLLKHYPRARQAPDAQYYIGKIVEMEGDLFKAFKEYQIVIDKYPFSDRSADIVEAQYELGVKMLEGKVDRNKILDAFIGADYNIVEVFRAVIKNAPYGEYAAPAQYKIALYLQGKDLFQESRDEFEKVINDYPDSEWARAAKYQIAVTDAKRSTGAQYDQEVTKAAVEEFHEFLKIYPDAELTNEAKEQISDLRNKEAQNKYVVAEFYEKRKKYESAKIYYQFVVDEYPKTEWASKALNKIRELSKK